MYIKKEAVMETQNRKQQIIGIVWRLVWIVIAIIVIAITMSNIFVPWLFAKTMKFDFAMCIAIPGIIFFILNMPTIIKTFKKAGVKGDTKSRGMQRILSIFFLIILLLAVSAFVGPILTAVMVIVKLVEIIKITKNLRATASDLNDEER